MLESAARAGSVTAMKHLDKRTSGETANPGGFVGGKKAEQMRAAEHAVSNSEWGDDLAPIAVPVRTN
jgi:DNA-binding IclR family transcriptional regulator